MDRPDATPVRQDPRSPATPGHHGPDTGSLVTATLSVTDDHSSVTQVLEVESALTQALPVPEQYYGAAAFQGLADRAREADKTQLARIEK